MFKGIVDFLCIDVDFFFGMVFLIVLYLFKVLSLKLDLMSVLKLVCCKMDLFFIVIMLLVFLRIFKL